MILPTVRRAELNPYQLRLADLWDEDTLLVAVLDRLAALGWLRQHQRPAYRKSGRISTAYAGDGGWPDVVAVHPSGLIIAAELKSERGSATREQRAWLERLQLSRGAAAGVWRPRDWHAGLVHDVLADPTRHLEAA